MFVVTQFLLVRVTEVFLEAYFEFTRSLWGFASVNPRLARYRSPRATSIQRLSSFCNPWQHMEHEVLAAAIRWYYTVVQCAASFWTWFYHLLLYVLPSPGNTVRSDSL